jgi:hypothetical protein
VLWHAVLTATLLQRARLTPTSCIDDVLLLLLMTDIIDVLSMYTDA